MHHPLSLSLFLCTKIIIRLTPEQRTPFVLFLFLSLLQQQQLRLCVSVANMAASTSFSAPFSLSIPCARARTRALQRPVVLSRTRHLNPTRLVSFPFHSGKTLNWPRVSSPLKLLCSRESRGTLSDSNIVILFLFFVLCMFIYFLSVWFPRKLRKKKEKLVHILHFSVML